MGVGTKSRPHFQVAGGAVRWHIFRMTETSSLSPSREAEALAARGNAPLARDLLERAAMAGDGDASFTLGVWTLSGRIVARDLEASRQWFGRAAEQGRTDARAIWTAFLANGTGGARDWPGALASLRAIAGHDADAQRQLSLIGAMALTATGDPLAVPAGEQVSASPHVTLFRALFTPAECAYVAALAEPFFRPADVIDPATGRLIRHPVRTSDAATFPLVDETPALHALNRRLAMASGTDATQGEPLQVLRYRPGQEYRPHVDALDRDDNQRLFTMLVWLDTDYEGGETFFLANGLKLRGETGDAILFRNADADGRLDPHALHAGLPVTRGTKLIASRWIRARPLDLADTGARKGPDGT